MTSITAADSPTCRACEDCVARLCAAAQDTQLLIKLLQSIDEVLQTVGESVDYAVELSNSLCSFPPTREAEGVEDETQQPRVPTAAPTDEYWRAWRTSTAADALFYRSGLSTSLCALEKTIAEVVAHSYVPRLRVLHETVQQLRDSAERDSRYTLTEVESSTKCGEWIQDALMLLAQVAEAPLRNAAKLETKGDECSSFPSTKPETGSDASAVWTSLETDLSTVAASLCAEPYRLMDCTKDASYDNRLLQQKQRVLQLLCTVVSSLTYDAAPCI
jgi:hypothetical protein